MKHLALLLLVSLCGYFWWRYARRSDRKALRKFVSAHLPWVALIVVAIFAALVTLFYGGAINLL